ncbi:MAG: hypothetical protein K0U54_06330 [Bacteroidetes bacterium]|nr:hypothetical protein [Bacteroidota bacterium]
MKYYNARTLFLFWVLHFLLTSTLMAQNYERVDATIEMYPKQFNSVEELSAFITRDFSTEEEKVRAIYTWLIHNVSYEPDEYKNFNFNFKNYRERNQKEEKTRQRVIKKTVKEGIAVCEGYAMVFERLCELQGISNYLVRGDVKTHFHDIGRPFKKIHMWNVAFIDGNPFLFDPTWGAGKYRDRFIKDPSYFYYKTPPKLFGKTHYPHQQEDTFLSHKFTKESFANMPLIINEELELEALLLQQQGVIASALEGGVIPFRIKSKEVQSVKYSFGKEKSTVPFTYKSGILSFEIPITLGQENLLIYFDDAPALGYKLK